jgi:multicomponent Na+:H+ antiporter subunit C
VIYILCLLLFMVGLFGVLTQKNLIKIVVSLGIMDYAMNLFMILLGYREGGIAPIVTDAQDAAFSTAAVDPLPQALVLTSIVIGLGVTALMVAIALRLYQTHGTYDITEIRNLRG